MLRRVGEFLQPPNDNDFPSLLFLVLPLPCVENSRYLTQDILLEITAACGLKKLIASHNSRKLAHFLWEYNGEAQNIVLTKKVHKSGKSRNNFLIL